MWGEYTKWLLAVQPRIWRISSYLVVLFSNLSWGNAWTLIDNSSLVHTWQQYKQCLWSQGQCFRYLEYRADTTSVSSTREGLLKNNQSCANSRLYLFTYSSNCIVLKSKVFGEVPTQFLVPIPRVHAVKIGSKNRYECSHEINYPSIGRDLHA